MVMTEVSVQYVILLVVVILNCRSLLFLIIAVVAAVGDRPCQFLSFLLVVIVFVPFGHLWILCIIID